MKKITDISSIPRPIKFEDRQQKIKKETEKIKQKQKELYNLGTNMIKKEK